MGCSFLIGYGLRKRLIKSLSPLFSLENISDNRSLNKSIYLHSNSKTNMKTRLKSSMNSHLDTNLPSNFLLSTILSRHLTLTLKVNVDGSVKKSSIFNTNNSISRNGNGDMVNANNTSLTNDVDEQAFNANVLLTKRFNKKGRTLSLNLIQSINKSNSEWRNINNFYMGNKRRN